MVRNVRRVTVLRFKLEMMEARTDGVAVAVRQIIGTVGKAVRKWERWA